MLMAWIGTAGLGIISAQFYRGVWVGRKVLGTDVWFTVRPPFSRQETHQPRLETNSLVTLAHMY